MKKNIMLAAISIYKQNGLKFTMLDLSKKLGISKKTLYKYYESKEEILIDIVHDFFYDVRKTETQVLHDNEMDSISKLKKIVFLMPEKYANIDLRELLNLRDKYPSAYMLVNRYISSDWENVIYVATEGMKNNELVDFDISIFKLIIESTLDRLISNDYLQHNNICFKDVTIEIMKILTEGIRSRRLEE